MAIYPDAIYKPVRRWKTRGTHVRVNLHTAVSNATSLFDFFNRSGNPTSHFYVREDGTVEQYVDTRYRAAADLQGNPDTISIETWDGYGKVWHVGQPPAWNDKQVAALVRLIAWIERNHSRIPLRLAKDSRRGSSSHGISWHRLGCNSYPALYRAGYRQRGGLRYSNSRGKTCPGDARIAQIPDILEAVITGEIPKGGGGGGGKEKPAPPKPSKKGGSGGQYPDIALLVDGVWGEKTTRALQIVLPRKYNGGKELLHDGVFGTVTKKAAQRWLKDLGYYDGRIDGKWGTLSEKALQAFLYDKELYRNGSYSKAVMVDGRFGSRSNMALQTYLNSQRKYL